MYISPKKDFTPTILESPLQETAKKYARPVEPVYRNYEQETRI